MASIGIDFGTTNSLLVQYDKDTNKFVYFNYNGSAPVPTSSTVWYYDDKIEVGNNARKAIGKYWDSKGEKQGHHFEKSIKLKLGTEYVADIFGRKVAPQDVAAEILKKLRNDALAMGERDSRLQNAVFTVPVNFSGKSRRALRDAANKAGMEVTTFIHEPFAAIVGYYFSHEENKSVDEIKNDLKSLEGQYILTFDWGGGTLDITIVKIEDGKMIEVGTSELTNLAGDKFDEDIARWAWSKYLDKISYKYDKEYLEIQRKKNWGKCLAIAESVKINLSKNQSDEFLCDYVVDGEDDIEEVLTREEFADLIKSTLDKACNKIDEALRKANIGKVNISHVLLTGGTCYIPAIQDRMKELFGSKVEMVKNADLVIAQGAAVVSEFGWLPFLTKDIQIELSNGGYWPIFEKGTPIPPSGGLSKQETFVCTDSRCGVAKIIIGDGIGQRNDSLLGIMNVSILGDNRFGDEISVNAVLDSDIVLKINAYSKMVHGVGHYEAYSERKTIEISQMCFGLDWGG